MKRKRLPKDQRNFIGNRLLEARRNAGLSQEEVVELLETQHQIKIGQPALSHLESRQRSIDDFEIRALAAVYGVSVAWLFEE